MDVDNLPAVLRALVDLRFTAVRRDFRPVCTEDRRKIPVEDSDSRVTVDLDVDIADVEMALAEVLMHRRAVEMVADGLPAILIAARVDERRAVVRLPDALRFLQVVIRDGIRILADGFLDGCDVLSRARIRDRCFLLFREQGCCRHLQVVLTRVIFLPSAAGQAAVLLS